VSTEKIQYLDDLNIHKTVEGNVLDDLKITRICCRRHMLTHVNIF
jgi:DNA-directed RNA polymerase subunit N (RpoN/RPB10)